MRNVLFVVSLFLASAAFASDEGEAFIAAGMRMSVEGKKDIAKDMLTRGIALSRGINPKAYLELAKLSEADKDVAVSLYFTSYQLMIQDPKAVSDCKFIKTKLLTLSKPTHELIVAMETYSADLAGISKVRKDELTQDAVKARTDELQLNKFVAGVTATPTLRQLTTAQVVGAYKWEQADGAGIMNLLEGGKIRVQRERGTAGGGSGSWVFDEKEQTLTISWKGWADEKHKMTKPGFFETKNPGNTGNITLERIINASAVNNSLRR